MYYILDEQGKPTLAPQEQYQIWYKHSLVDRIVGRTKVGTLTVFTHFIGIDPIDADLPLLRETTIANRKHHEIDLVPFAGTREQRR